MTKRGWLAPTLLTVICLPILLVLGFWQLDRAEQKQRRLDRYLARGQLDVLRLPASIVDAEEFVYYRVSASGIYDSDRQFLVDNIILRGRPGYHVITPLRIAGSDTRVLVNRGWVAWGNDRNVLPQVPPSGQLLRVQGRAVVPADDFFALQDESNTNAWDLRWQNLDMNRFSSLAGYPVQPIVILLDPDSTGDVLSREWDAPQNIWIQRHRAYAFQWFALALTLVVLYVFYRRRGRSIERS